MKIVVVVTVMFIPCVKYLCSQLRFNDVV